MMTKFKDSLLAGSLAGLIGPILGILIFYFYNFAGQNFLDFMQLSAEKRLLSPLLSLCAVINLGVFYLFIRVDYLSSAKGVILSTFLYGLAIVVIKFVL